ncbi:MAG: tetratricopeptide repeat protein [Deltaproteobacteria bacterium]|nr:tetratricopeptide repeat protein [Deltaproteobacteria bacterium]
MVRIGFLLALALAAGDARAAEPAPVPQDPQVPIRGGPADVEEYRSAQQRFVDRMTEFKDDTRDFIRVVEIRRRQELEQGFGRIIQNLREEEDVVRRQAEERFEAFLLKYPDAQYTPHVMFRLAEMYFEDAENRFLFADAERNQRLSEMDPRFAEDIPEPRKDYAKPLGLYRTIVDRYPGYEKIDGVYYMLGYCNTEENALDPDRAAGVEALQTLVSRFPGSAFANDASMRLGEYYFQENLVEEAIPYYQRIVDAGEAARYFDKGLYKLAWSHFLLANGQRLDEYWKAMALFTKLLDYSRKLLLTRGEASPMDKEAIDYMAISIADLADHEGISPVAQGQRWFQEVGPRDYEWDIYVKLADVLFQYARYEQSIAAYEYLQQRWPLAPENPLYQHTVSRLYMTMQPPDRDASNKAQLVLAERYNDRTAWWTANRSNPDAQATARGFIESSLATIATEHHLLAQKTGKPEDFSRAADKYQEYLSRFPFADDYYVMEWYLADALFYANRMKEAEREYVQLLKGTNHPYRDGSTYRLMKVRRQLLVERYGKVEAVPPDAIVERVDTSPFGGEVKVYMLTDEHKAFIEACDAVVETEFTATDFAEVRRRDLPALTYIPAQILFEFGHYEEARPRFDKIVASFPRSPEAAFAAGLAIRSFQEEKDLQKVRFYTNKYGNMSLGPQEVAAEKKKEWDELKEGSTFKIAYALIDEGKREEAATAFLAFLDEFPRSPLAKDALFNAANSLEILGRADDANALFEKYINRYPRDERSEGLYFRIASNYAGILELEQAIRYYTSLVEYFPKAKNAPIALYNAAFLKIGLGDQIGAARDFENYATRYPEQDDAERVFFVAGDRWEAVGDDQAVEFYRRYLRRYGGRDPDHTLTAHYRIIRILQKQGKQRQADQEWRALSQAFERLAAQGPTSPTARNYVAEAVFRDILSEFERFKVVKFTGIQEKDAPLLATQKPEELEALKTHCLAVITRYQDFQWTSAALYVQAAAHFAYADMLFEAPPPKGFNEDQVAFYRETLDKLRIPVEEKGRGFAEAALAKAREASAWSEWQDRTLSLLNERFPAEYAREKLEERYTMRTFVLPDRGPLTILLPEPPAQDAGTGGTVP